MIIEPHTHIGPDGTITVHGIAAIRARLIERARHTLAAHRAGLRDTLTDQHDDDMVCLLDDVDRLIAEKTRITAAWRSARGRARTAHIGLADAEHALANKAGTELLNRTLLKSARTVDGHFEVELEPARELLMLWCAAVRRMLDGAENYGECEVSTKPPTEAVAMDIQDGRHNTDSYTLTLQRRFRPTPHEMRERMERERDEARADRDEACKRADHWEQAARVAIAERNQALADATGRRALLDTAGAVANSNKEYADTLHRNLTKIRRTVAEWIYDVNSGDDRDASDLMFELEQAGVPLTVELNAIEEQREQESAEAELIPVPGIPACAEDCPCRTVDTGTYDTPDDTTTTPAPEPDAAIEWTGDNITEVMAFMDPEQPIHVNSLSELRFTNADELVGVNTPDGLKVARIGDSIARFGARLTVVPRSTA